MEGCPSAPTGDPGAEPVTGYQRRHPTSLGPARRATSDGYASSVSPDHLRSVHCTPYPPPSVAACDKTRRAPRRAGLVAHLSVPGFSIGGFPESLKGSLRLAGQCALPRGRDGSLCPYGSRSARRASVRRAPVFRSGASAAHARPGARHPTSHPDQGAPRPTPQRSPRRPRRSKGPSVLGAPDRILQSLLRHTPRHALVHVHRVAPLR